MWASLERAALPRPARLLGQYSRSRRFVSSRPDNSDVHIEDAVLGAASAASSGHQAPTKSAGRRTLAKIPRSAAKTSSKPTRLDLKQPDALSIASRRRDQADYQEALMQSRSSSASTRKSSSGKEFASAPLPTLWRKDSFQKRSSSSMQLDKSAKGKEREVQPEVHRPQPAGTPAISDVAAQAVSPKKLRKNPVGVQLLSPSLHDQLFPGAPLSQPPKNLVNLSREHLKRHGLEPDRAAVLNEIDFKMPPLQGQNIKQHFRAIGKEVAEPYLSMGKELVASQLPPVPEYFNTEYPGWVRYEQDGSYYPVDDLCDEQLVSFDVETLYKLSPYPVMAAAASPKYWYTWLTPTIFESPPETLSEPRPKWDKNIREEHPHTLIPLFTGSHPRIVIGHNVGYDRARVAEEYSLEGTSTRWLDTLSFHMASRGITSHQIPTWMSYTSQKRAGQTMRDDLLEHAEAIGDDELVRGLQSGEEDEDSDEAARRWQDVTAINSLAEVAALHCGYPLDKTIRQRFGDESITHASQLRDELQELLAYNANDVRVTHDVFSKVFPLFLDSCPHPASFAGILPMGKSFLPIDESWKNYLRSAEELYREMDENVKAGLRVLADNLRKAGPDEANPWLSQLNWSEKRARWPDQGPDAPVFHSELSSGSGTPSVLKASTSTSALASDPTADLSTQDSASMVPLWYAGLQNDKKLSSLPVIERIIPLVLRVTFKGYPVVYLSKELWCCAVPRAEALAFEEIHGEPVDLKLSSPDWSPESLFPESVFFRVSENGKPRTKKLFGQALIRQGHLGSAFPHVLHEVLSGNAVRVHTKLMQCAEEAIQRGNTDPWGAQLDWTEVNTASSSSLTLSTKGKKPTPRQDHGRWPKWYWDLTIPSAPPGTLDLTQKKSVTPLLLRLQWHGYPLIRHPQFKWLFRIPRSDIKGNRGHAFGKEVAANDSSKNGDLVFDIENYAFFRIPHKGGEDKNVGSPFAKGFVHAIESKELEPAPDPNDKDSGAMTKIASDAMNLNVFCSYWISSRERIMDQLAVYRNERSGMILPQVIPMGTVTRRAVESTWLTASNAKKNRVGSELKSMIRAPPGYSIVGADVDSEELWISSVMGDAQFGMHGATAIGWMTLEGTKAAGTDLHSKTAGILGTSRDQAKIFNYSRIYGAGQKHAIQLLMQSDPTLTKETAAVKAQTLYGETKGQKTFRGKGRHPAALPSLWHGGSESFLFNLIESIATSERPLTPALGCGVTSALRKGYLEDGAAYLPSRTNWVVQSSGVDYLHMLITSMEYLIQQYDIQARYLLSVHDEVRYLAKEEDRYRTAIALQVANAWTRALFCYNLGIDDLPQGVAFFSAVDLDHVLRKEVFMTCETPSHRNSIPAGESLDMEQLLAVTNNGDLGTPVKESSPVGEPTEEDKPVALPLSANLRTTGHQMFLAAQMDKSSVRARAWLDAQPALKDVHGKVLPAEKKERRVVVREALQQDPAYFERQRNEVFTDAEIEGIASMSFEAESTTKRRPRVVRAKKED